MEVVDSTMKNSINLQLTIYYIPPLKSLRNGRSGGLVYKVPVGSFGVVGDAIKLKEKSLNMMQISQNTMGENITIVGGSLTLGGEHRKWWGTA